VNWWPFIIGVVCFFVGYGFGNKGALRELGRAERWRREQTLKNYWNRDKEED